MKGINKVSYFISGVYFEDMVAYPFVGFIFQDPEAPDKNANLIGRMFDEKGASELSDVFMFVETSFTKRYIKNGETLRYRFEKADGAWLIGKYLGTEGSEGFVKCNIVEVDEKFLALPECTISLK